MFTGTFFGIIALLYYLSFLLLAAMVVFLGYTSRHRPRSSLRRIFCWLALALLLWQVTLFLEPRTVPPTGQLWLGRLNFTAIVFAVYLSLRFIQKIPAKSSRQAQSLSWPLAETWLLALVTLFTPLVDAEEHVRLDQVLTRFGSFFPFYLLHVVGFLAAALFTAYRERKQAKKQRVQRQLAFIASGLLAMGGTACFTNAMLPYLFGDFRFCDVGTLSVLFFVAAVGYAVLVHRLFDLKIVFRETLVYGIMMVFVLSAYSATVFLITNYLTEGQDKIKQFAVLLIAFSFDPLRRLLEVKADRWLFPELRDSEHGKRRRRRYR